MCKALAIFTISHLASAAQPADRFKRRHVAKELAGYYDIVQKKWVFPQLTFGCGEESFDIEMRKIEAFQTTISNANAKSNQIHKSVCKIQFSLKEDRQFESRAEGFAKHFKEFLKSLKGEEKTKKAEIQGLEKEIARTRERIDPDSPVKWQKVVNYWNSLRLSKLEKQLRQKLAVLERRIVIKFPEVEAILDKELLTKILTGKKAIREKKVAEWEIHTDDLQNSCDYDCNRLCLSGNRLKANYNQKKKILELTFTYADIQGTAILRPAQIQKAKTINALKREIVKAQEKSRLSRHDKSKVKQLIQKVEDVEGQTWHCANALEKIQKMKESLATPVKKRIAQANALASQKFQPARKFKTYEMETDTPTLIEEIGEMDEAMTAVNSKLNNVRKLSKLQKKRRDFSSQKVRAIAEKLYGKKGAQEFLSAFTNKESSRDGARRRLKRLSQGEMCK